MSQEEIWGCWQGSGVMPAGFLSALCRGQSRVVKSWDAKPRVDIGDGKTKYQRLYSPVLHANTGLLLKPTVQ